MTSSLLILCFCLFIFCCSFPTTDGALPVLELRNFQLRPNSMGTALRDRADSLGNVLGAKATVTDIMNNLNRPAGGGKVAEGRACNTAGLATNPRPPFQQYAVAIDRSICFDADDTDTSQWYPQGVTTVADMQADQQWGNGLRPILVSWYDHNNNADGKLKGVRISFVDHDSGKYRHVLLVYPKEKNGIMDYDAVRVSQDTASASYKKALHAGGILWYGNFLFVADTARGFRMFDVRRIFDLGTSPRGTTDGDHLLGYQQGTYYGYGYRYIMPQIGSWTVTASPGVTCSDSRDRAPNFSFVSLDRSGTDHLLAGEYCNGSRSGWGNEKKSKGRVIAWKIADAFVNGELNMDTRYRWEAVNAYKLPVSNIQGATRFEHKWYLSRSNGSGIHDRGRLYISAKVTPGLEVLKVASDQSLGIGPEDLSHWPKGTPTQPTLGHLWTVGEHEGKRMLYSVVPAN